MFLMTQLMIHFLVQKGRVHATQSGELATSLRVIQITLCGKTHLGYSQFPFVSINLFLLVVLHFFPSLIN